MSIPCVAFVNNRAGWQAVRWLRGRQDTTLAALVVHEPERARYGDRIAAAAGLPPSRVFTAGRLDEPATRAALQALAPAIGISVYFGHILRPEVLALFPRGCVNLHPAYLPFNRGAHPNVWPLLDGSPAGVTLHYIDAGIDTGDVVARERVPVLPGDTAHSLYRRLERAALHLLQRTWPAVVAGVAPRTPQDPAAGSTHRRRDLAALDEIDLDRTYTARELLARLRARTFPPYAAAYFRAEGRRVYVRVCLESVPDVPHAAPEALGSPAGATVPERQ